MDRRVVTTRDPPVTDWYYDDETDVMVITTTCTTHHHVHMGRRRAPGVRDFPPAPVPAPVPFLVPARRSLPSSPEFDPAALDSEEEEDPSEREPLEEDPPEGEASEESSAACSRVSGPRVRLRPHCIYIPPYGRGRGRGRRGRTSARGPYRSACHGWIEEETDEESDARFG